MHARRRAAPRAGPGDRNLVKNLVKPGKNLVQNQVFLEAEALTRNLGFLEDGHLRSQEKCIGDHWKSREPGIWNLGKHIVINQVKAG